MRHLLTWLLAALLCCPSLAARAQEPAQRTVSELLASLRSQDVIRLAFTEQVRLPFLKHPLESKGELVIHPDGHLLRTVKTPTPSATVVTLSKVVVQDESGTTTIDASATPQIVAAVKVLRAVLTADVDALRDRYQLTVDAPADRPTWLVTLQSRKPESNFFERCVVTGEADRVLAITLDEKDGVVRRIAFDGASKGAKLNPEEKSLLKLATAGE